MKQLQELAIVKNQQNKKHKRLRRRKGASWMKIWMKLYQTIYNEKGINIMPPGFLVTKACKLGL
jgi:hypothetical protein